jgi:8-oxo-dGTP pyrophosphatase MutT (NUDIX family)
MGASVIPFCVHQGEVLFLFHTTFSGRRAGCLVDFGGGGEKGESWQETAMREFIEETETMFFSNDVTQAVLNEKSIENQMPLLASLFDRTIDRYPDWWCAKKTDENSKKKHKDWRTYFIEFQFRELAPLNNEWAHDQGQRFKKRRELFWVSSDALLDIYRFNPERLWKRLRQLEGVEDMIESITSTMTEQSSTVNE